MKKDIKIKLWGRIFILPIWVKFVAIGAVAIIVIIVGFYLQKKDDNEVVVITAVPMVTPSPTSIIEVSSPPEIYVYVVGEVNAPGVYELVYGSMVSQAVDAAGGFTDKADREAINLVEILTGNTMIKVPAEGENVSDVIVPESDSNSDKQESAKKININTADVEELCTLSGVGESTAKKIISYRESNGPFGAIEDIMNVPGIKEARFLAIKEDICVG